MHGAAQWSSFMILHQGGSIILPSNTRALDADDIWRTVEREKVGTLSIVGDAFARPLLDQLSKGSYDLSSMSILGSGGAIISPPFKEAFLAALPNLMIFDGFGSSEPARRERRSPPRATPWRRRSSGSDTCVLDGLTHKLDAGENAVGGSPAPAGCRSAISTTPPRPRRPIRTCGTRYAVPATAPDVRRRQHRRLRRDSVCINSGGEKIFAEESKALKHHPAVYDVVVAAPRASAGASRSPHRQFRDGQRPRRELIEEATNTSRATSCRGDHRHRADRALINLRYRYRWAKYVIGGA